jgi:hypothetical protein
MIQFASHFPVARAALSGAAGFGLGLLYFAALRLSVAAFTGGRGWIVPMVLTGARIGGIALALGIAAKFGAVPLLSAFLGFLIARGVSLRQSRVSG